MRQVPIRLGPLALLLVVISICMTTLGVLAFATAGADWKLAESYAGTVRIRYGLEAEGQRFLQEAAETLEKGNGLAGLADTETDEEGCVWKTFRDGAFGLRVGIRPEGERGLRIVAWRSYREWEPDVDMDLWSGE